MDIRRWGRDHDECDETLAGGKESGERLRDVMSEELLTMRRRVKTMKPGEANNTYDFIMKKKMAGE